MFVTSEMILDGVVVRDTRTGHKGLRHSDCVGPDDVIEGHNPSPNAGRKGYVDRKCGACGVLLPFVADGPTVSEMVDREFEASDDCIDCDLCPYHEDFEHSPCDEPCACVHHECSLAFHLH